MADEALAEKKCVPCDEGTPPLKGEALGSLAKRIPEWEVVEEHHLKRTFEFDDFQGALDWVNDVGRIAEQEGHHPWFHFTYGEVTLELYTHKSDGLTENDFIVAAKIDEAWKRRG